jgi:hypothetical protein
MQSMRIVPDFDELKHSQAGFSLCLEGSPVEQSKAFNDDPRPMVIISASGMAETGRILHHLKNNIEKGSPIPAGRPANVGATRHKLARSGLGKWLSHAFA